MSESQNSSPSAWAQALGYAGLLPFAGLSLATSMADPAHAFGAGRALVGYGAVIASFLGALHWGLSMRTPQQSPVQLGWGVIPSLLGWSACMLGTASGLLVIAALLWACFGVDRLVYPRYHVQGWLRMRLALTCVASAGCIAAAIRLYSLGSVV